jgi:GNAT superfamily N-acetyltransferase
MADQDEQEFVPSLDSVFSWKSQVRQYPAKGPRGLGYFPGPTEYGTVDCLLYRSQWGDVIGILNHYPFDAPPWEVTGNVNIWIHPGHHRKGIATVLWTEAVRRWGVTLGQQRFTVEGAALATYLRGKGFE